MTDAELLAKVKTGLSVGGTYNDAQLQIKTSAVKGFMLNAGVTLDQLETDLGIATLTIGVTDIWNLSSGEVKFSDAFTLYLLPQLMAVSLPDEEE